MVKYLLVILTLVGFSSNGFAQAESPAVKKFNHTAGFQANEILRQVFNLNNNNSIVDNPYLAVYSIHCAKTGWGLSAGLGISYSKVLDKFPIARESKTNAYFYRIGGERRIELGKKFQCSYGLDLTAANEYDRTFNITVTNLGSTIDSSVSSITDKRNTFGGGPRFTLGFHISDRLMISTEATMYYSKTKRKENVNIVNTVTSLFNNQVTVTSSNFNAEAETDGISFSIPVAIFLAVKF